VISRNVYFKLLTIASILLVQACGQNGIDVVVEPPADHLLLGKWKTAGEHPAISYEVVFDIRGQVAMTTLNNNKLVDIAFNPYTIISPETVEFYLTRNIRDEKVNVRITLEKENNNLARLECFLPDHGKTPAYLDPPLACFFHELKRVK
jgi:hypothetical protein